MPGWCYARDAPMDPAAQAKLNEFVAYTRERFPEQSDYTYPDEPMRFVSASEISLIPSEFHVELGNKGDPHQVGLDEVMAMMREAFDRHTVGLHGPLVWRVRPEIEHYRSSGWRYYMRFTIPEQPTPPKED